jgi:hypothetical protein
MSEFAAYFETFNTDWEISANGRAVSLSVTTDAEDFCRDLFDRLAVDAEDLEAEVEWWGEWGARRHAADIRMAEIRAKKLSGAQEEPQDDGDFEGYVVAAEAFIAEVEKTLEEVDGLIAPVNAAIAALEVLGLGEVETSWNTAWLTLPCGTCLGIDAEADSDGQFSTYNIITTGGDDYLWGDCDCRCRDLDALVQTFQVALEYESTPQDVETYS